MTNLLRSICYIRDKIDSMYDRMEKWRKTCLRSARRRKINQINDWQADVSISRKLDTRFKRNVIFNFSMLRLKLPSTHPALPTLFSIFPSHSVWSYMKIRGRTLRQVTISVRQQFFHFLLVAHTVFHMLRNINCCLTFWTF